MTWIWVWLIGTGVTAVGLRTLQIVKPEAFFIVKVDPKKKTPDAPFSAAYVIASALWFLFIPAVASLLIWRLVAREE
jgi:hypothetical protein